MADNKIHLNQENRRKQMTKLCNWLIDELELKTGTALADALGISQSTISGHLAQKADAATPKDELKEVYCNFLNSITLKRIACDKWTIATFTEYLDSRMTPDAFIKYLNEERVPIERSMYEINDSLTDEEKLELLVIVAEDLKKNRVLTPACA